MQTAWTHYGEDKLDLEIPEGWNLIDTVLPKEVPTLIDPQRKVDEIVERPIMSSSISEIVKGKRNIVIISDDVRRPTPVHVILPALLDHLNSAGIPDQRINVIVGRGGHPSLTPKQFETKLGKNTLDRVHVAEHNADDEKTIAYVGTTSTGTPIWLNKSVLEADVKIGIGGVTYHSFAGYSGGAKIVLPGVAGRKTITGNHFVKSFQQGASMGVADGNPARAEMEEVARKLGLDMKIDAVLNAENDLVGIFAGDFVSEHREAARLYDSMYRARVPRMADVSIASAYPYDTHEAQTFKALGCAARVTKNGGTVIVLSPMRGGVRESVKNLYQNYFTPDLTTEQIRKKVQNLDLPEDVQQGAAGFCRTIETMQRIEVIYVTDMKWKNGLNQIRFKNVVPTLDDALEMAQKKHGKGTDLLVIPRAQMLIEPQ